jgi:UTP--glucose-1-phosphate uridylyltransferase
MGEDARMSSNGLAIAQEKMRAAGQSEGAIRGFSRAYELLVGGTETMLASADIEPVDDVASLEQLSPAPGALAPVAVIKLNGGLATSMGLRSPKSLVEARDGRSFLDIIVGQTLAVRRRLGISLPLLLMDSMATRDETLRALAGEPELTQDLPADFLQSMVPKLEATKLVPVSWPKRSNQRSSGARPGTATSMARWQVAASSARCSIWAFATRCSPTRTTSARHRTSGSRAIWRARRSRS